MEVVALAVDRDIDTVIEGVTDICCTSDEVITVRILGHKLAAQRVVAIVKSTSDAVVARAVWIRACGGVEPTATVCKTHHFRRAGVVGTDHAIVTLRIIREELAIKEPVTFVDGTREGVIAVGVILWKGTVCGLVAYVFGTGDTVVTVAIDGCETTPVDGVTFVERTIYIVVTKSVVRHILAITDHVAGVGGATEAVVAERIVRGVCTTDSGYAKIDAAGDPI
jgi:hypothetical protein